RYTLENNQHNRRHHLLGNLRTGQARGLDVVDRCDGISRGIALERLAIAVRVHTERVEELDGEALELAADELGGEELAEVAVAIELRGHGPRAAGTGVLIPGIVERDEEECLLFSV